MHCLVILCRSGNKFVSLVASLLQGDVISWPRVIFRRKFYFYKFMLGRKWTEYFWFYFTSILCIFDHFYLFLSIFIYYWQFYKFLPIFYVFSVISAIFGNIKKNVQYFRPPCIGLVLHSPFLHWFMGLGGLFRLMPKWNELFDIWDGSHNAPAHWLDILYIPENLVFPHFDNYLSLIFSIAFSQIY